MRFTITLDDDLFRVAKSMAKAEDTSISRAVNSLIRRGLEPRVTKSQTTHGNSALSSFPVSRNCRSFTEEEVGRIDEEEEVARWTGF